MAATKSDIRVWLEKGLAEGASHVIIAFDTFDYSDYPVYIQPGVNPRDYPMGKMQRAMECYDLSLPIEVQLLEPRANHWTMKEAKVDTPDELDKIRAEDAANREAKVYETLEDDIVELRSTIKAQAILLRELGLAGFNNFLDRVLALEKLQCKYDEWDPEFDQEQFSDV